MNPFSLALAQMNPIVGDLAANAARIHEMAAAAADLGAELILFPEMALVGYPPEDLLLLPTFRAAAMQAARDLAAATAHLPCDLLFGSVWEEDGCVYNGSILASAGTLTCLRAKHDLPNYGVFDEKRVFTRGDAPRVFTWRGRQLGILICEEVWDAANARHLAAQGAEILLVQNASPYHIGKARERKHVVDAAVAATGLPLVYLNLVGGQDELVFDGRSYAVSASGDVLLRMAAFREELRVMRVGTSSSPESQRDDRAIHAEASAGFPYNRLRDSGNDAPPLSDEATIYSALVLGLRDYVQKNRFPGVVLGLSGGIDSGLTAAIAADALGAEKVHTIRLPSPFTSVDSMEDAEQLAAALHLRMDTIPITPLMDSARQTLHPLFAGRHADVTEENIQARLRGLLVMGLSNKFGSLVLTTGNKSEMAVGYATLYGDMCGGFSVLKDVYKTTVFKLSRWRNTLDSTALAALGFHGAAGVVIPSRMIEKPPTAELRPNQRDEDSLPPYALLDTMLHSLIEQQRSLADLVAQGMDEATVRRVAQLVARAEYKRRQSAPGVKITPLAFGRDRRFPITNRFGVG